jgi:hypothetical protein
VAARALRVDILAVILEEQVKIRVFGRNKVSVRQNLLLMFLIMMPKESAGFPGRITGSLKKIAVFPPPAVSQPVSPPFHSGVKAAIRPSSSPPAAPLPVRPGAFYPP